MGSEPAGVLAGEAALASDKGVLKRSKASPSTVDSEDSSQSNDFVAISAVEAAEVPTRFEDELVWFDIDPRVVVRAVGPVGSG